MSDLKDHFRPEFLNRVDNIVVFRPLTHKAVKEIVKLHIGYLMDRIKKRDIKIIITPGGLNNLAKLSFDPNYGARPVRRKIQELVEDELTLMFLNGDLKDGDTVKIEKNKDSIKIVKV